MTENIKPLEWKKNPLYIAGIITAIFFVITIIFFYFNVSQNMKTVGTMISLVSGGITYLFYKNQCPKCKRIFTLKKVSDEVIKEWEEPKQYKEKTIYYYSDGETQKDVKYGATKTFIARYEQHKEGYICKKCGETSYKTQDIFLNKDGWLRVTTPNKVTTSVKPPSFDLGAFEPTYYNDRYGKRKAIPKEVKVQLWKKYNGSNYQGKCFVCGEKIDTHHFEAGHVIPASKGGGDEIWNLRPICSGCNKSMKDMNLDEYKKRYYSHPSASHKM